MSVKHENEALPTESLNSDSLRLMDDQIEETDVLYEDVRRRDEKSKHFRLKNGNYMAVIYDRPVHKKDKLTGKYVDINHEFKETDDEYEADFDKYKVKLPKKEGKRKYVTVDKDGREIGWRYIRKSSDHRKNAIANFSTHKNNKKWDLKVHPTIQYEKTDRYTSLAYDVSENGVKESIVLSKNPGTDTFNFELKLKGLVPVLSDDKKKVLIYADDIVIDDNVIPELVIPPANMIDANGIYSEAIHYELDNSDSNPILKLVVESGWLSAENRKYPVVIDPRIEIPNTENAGTLTMVEVCSNGTKTQSGDSRRIGIDENGNAHRLYIKFDIPNLATGYKIVKAGINFHQKDNEYACLAENYIVSPAKSSWSPSSITWSNQPGGDVENAVDAFVGFSISSQYPFDIDITESMKKWCVNKNTFRGLVVQKEDENVSTVCCNADENVTEIVPTYMDIYSIIAAEENRAKVYIEYVSEDMYSDHQKFHTFEAGRAGTGSINLFTGKMSFAHGDITTEGVKLPLSVSHLYRHEYVDESATNKYGHGWRLSVEQTLEIVNQFGVVAVYTNAQGKRHYFIDDGNGNITDDAGLGLTFKEEDCVYSGYSTKYTLSDDKGNKMMFNADGKLIQLVDVNGTKSYLTYSNGNLIRVKDGNRKEAKLLYNEDGMLTSIVDPDGRSLEYAYDSDGNLISITYPYNENSDHHNDGPLHTTFEYEDGTHRLEKINDYSGTGYVIEYSNEVDESGEKKVVAISSSGSKCVSDGNVITKTTPVADDKLLIEYRASSTALQSERTKIKTVYRFDENGRETSSYQDLTEVVDSEMITETTATEIGSYASIVGSNEVSSNLGKYRSLSVTMNNDASDELNLLDNGFFTEGDTTPTGWKVSGATVGASGVSDTCYLQDKKSFWFGSNNNRSTKALEQTVTLCNRNLDGNVLVASAWAKASGQTTGRNVKFALQLRVVYENGDSELYTEDFDRGYDGWQYVAVPFVIRDDYNPASVTVRLDYSLNKGNCYFTNVRLVAVDGIITENQYRNDGTDLGSMKVFGEDIDIKMMTSKKDGVLRTVDYIDMNSDIVITRVIDKDWHIFDTYYKYDSEHNLIKTEDPRGMVIEYTYNEYGKELTRKTYHKSNPNSYMYSEYTYEDDNFVKTERDPRYSFNGEELKTTYERDTSRNLLLKQTAVNGQAFNYTYDDKTDDLTSLSSIADNKNNENQFFYTNGYLTRVAHNGFNFKFAFDEFGRSKSVSVGDGTTTTDLMTMNYSEVGVNDVVETTYASGEKNSVTTNLFGNPIVSTYTDKNGNTRDVTTATYDSVGKVKQMVDKERGVCYTYSYDAKGNVTKVVETSASTGAVLATNTFVFNSDQRLVSKTYSAVGQTYRPIYEKNGKGHVYTDNEILGIQLDGKFIDQVTKDGLRRANEKTFSVDDRDLFSESYEYLSTPFCSDMSIETEIVSKLTSCIHKTNGSVAVDTYEYTYDKAGNLETVSRNGSLVYKYYYDGLNRLKREDNHDANATYTWSYDVGGNITEKRAYCICNDINLGGEYQRVVYEYATNGWKDQLVSYGGQSCTYDALGNPITYRGHNLQWTKVRRLASYDSNTFEYGASGIRYKKNDTVYTLDGNKILRESNGTKTITYYHGGSGVVGFNYNGSDYYFRKNLQGDVIEIYNSAGLKVASYLYDAWGKVLEVNNYTGDKIGTLNPIRYRGYYYDVETGLYYLNSRYYDPETGRFINADTTDVLENAKYDINGLNLYAYCDNNPVAGRDEEGDASFWKKLAVAVAVVAVIAVGAAVVAAATAATGGAAGAALCAVTSTLVGAAKGAVIGAVTGAVTGAVVGGVQGAVEGYKETGTLEGTLRGMGKGALKGAVQGAADGMISGMVSGAFAGAMNPSFCFVAGTAVLTTLGKKTIENIQVGDTIPCVDHITGEAAEKKVISTTVNKVNRLIELDIDGEIIRCTETHPFQVKGRGWVDAANLVPNDVVYTKDWGTATVKSVTILELDEPVEVFNFEVEDCHTYFVGDIGVLVHNADCGNSYKSLKKGNYRNNALKYNKSDGQGLVAHHKLPQQFRTQFEARGINIDSPVYIELLDPTNHTAIHKAGYNLGWSTFFQNYPNATYVDIMKFAGLM